jgi:hypothetical protein
VNRKVRWLEVLAICIAAMCTAGGAWASSSGTTTTTELATAAPTTTTAPGDGLPDGAAKIAIDLNRESLQLAAVDRDRDAIAPRVSAAQSAVDVADGFLAQNRTDLAIARGVARARAADAYVRSSRVGGSTPPIDGNDGNAAALQYSQATAAEDTSALDSLTTLQTRLEAYHAARVTTRDELAAEKSRLDARHDSLTAARTRDRTELDGWGAVPVMGDATLTPEQIAAWYRSTGSVAQLAAGTTIDDLARLYVAEGAAEHVRGDLAFAQAMIETGAFSVDPGNNYSGIGTCDSCTAGDMFPAPQDGVRAQIQLLRNYADPDSRATRLAHPPAPGIYGTGPDAARHYDSFFLKGAAPLWNQMGGGNWATDPVYAPKVIGMFTNMLAYAAAHPA